jgi:hypothetical protein
MPYIVGAIHESPLQIVVQRESCGIPVIVNAYLAAIIPNASVRHGGVAEDSIT